MLVEGSGSVQVMTDPDSGGPKHTNPQHRLLLFRFGLKVVTNEKGEAVGDVLTIIC